VMFSASPPAPVESIYVPRPNIGMTTPSFNVIVVDSEVGIRTPDDIIADILRNKINIQKLQQTLKNDLELPVNKYTTLACTNNK